MKTNRQFRLSPAVISAVFLFASLAFSPAVARAGFFDDISAGLSQLFDGLAGQGIDNRNLLAAPVIPSTSTTWNHPVQFVV